MKINLSEVVTELVEENSLCCILVLRDFRELDVVVELPSIDKKSNVIHIVRNIGGY